MGNHFYWQQSPAWHVQYQPNGSIGEPDDCFLGQTLEKKLLLMKKIVMGRYRLNNPNLYSICT